MLECVSQRDAHGHGTHTALTAAGAAVPVASVLSIGTGVAQGMGPGAHITIYKVCWFNGCYRSDILTGMDDAIRDGVDVLSLSLGGFPIPFSEDSIAIGSLRATERGVTVVCAAGNNRPVPSSVATEDPWIITVARARWTGCSRRPSAWAMAVYESSSVRRRLPSSATRDPFPRQESEGRWWSATVELMGEPRTLENEVRRQRIVFVHWIVVLCFIVSLLLLPQQGEAVREAGVAGMVLANSEGNQQGRLRPRPAGHLDRLQRIPASEELPQLQRPPGCQADLRRDEYPAVKGAGRRTVLLARAQPDEMIDIWRNQGDQELHDLVRIEVGCVRREKLCRRATGVWVHSGVRKCKIRRPISVGCEAQGCVFPSGLPSIFEDCFTKTT
ncbi:hypothetical protein BHM03_00022494 [Ensete ventricosum]|nr:hypothetical protein BHM03_00022494 [Ensete ventricosum]